MFFLHVSICTDLSSEVRGCHDCFDKKFLLSVCDTHRNQKVNELGSFWENGHRDLLLHLNLCHAISNNRKHPNEWDPNVANWSKEIEIYL